MSDRDFWQAVLRRDARYDGVFVYGVSSTGIYCRPSCPSRRPGRDRVTFHADAAAAEKAGFRACRRCHPQKAAPADPWLDRVRRACAALEAGEEQLALAGLADAVGADRFQLHRHFKKLLGVTPREYGEAARSDRLKSRLRQGGTVTDALYDSGYGSSRALYEKSTSRLGMTPRAYQREGTATTITYGVGMCSLGRVLFASTSKGICSIKIGDDAAALIAELQTEFPAAAIRAGGPGQKPLLEAVLRRLDGTAPHVDLPLDVRGTAFRQRVWAALAAIPSGETRSYGEIAAALGQPGAARAVGSACGANDVAVLIPCHRAVRENGAMGGYRWGIDRKRALLDREKEKAAAPGAKR